MNVDDLYSKGFRQTCSLDRPKHNGICFAKNLKNLFKLAAVTHRVFAFVPVGWREILFSDHNCNVARLPENVTAHECEHPIWEWALVHNEINPVALSVSNEIDPSVTIHPSAIIGADGLRYMANPDAHNDPWTTVTHIGNVVIGKNVRVGANTVIHRAVLDSTMIHDGVKIGALCNIGHNAVIGAHTLIGPGAIIGGSVHIGEYSFIGMSVVILNGTSMCDHVMVGCGATVVKDITEPGTYAGNPARLLHRETRSFLTA